MYKKIFCSLIVMLLAGTFLFAQDSSAVKPVDWNFSASKKADGNYELVIQGKIAGGWKLFSTTAKDEELNTRIVLDSSAAQIVSVEEKGTIKNEKEPLLDNMLIHYFIDNIEFHVTVKANDAKSIKGAVNYMAMKGEDVVGPEEAPFRFAIDASGNIVTKSGTLTESSTASQALIREKIDLNNPVNTCGGTGVETKAEDKSNNGSGSLWKVFILGFLGGLIALITPCVFPMIPLTVSFFTKGGANRKKGITNALLYGFCIFFIYVALSLPFHLFTSLDAGILNNISTNVWLNIIFFVIFFVFALSFFGLFEITLPSGIANKASSKSSMGSFIGIFFMALTLAVVSFSCTGPILGSLLALSNSAGAWPLTMGMAGFGLALGLPFALFAMFPNWLNSMPKSGGWLTTVKITLGFIELALAIKFLSNADLVERWGLLKRETFILLWIIIGACLSLYLFNIIKFKYEGPAKMSKTRITFGVLFAAFTIYLIPGLTNTKYANLSLISGFPPPLTYSWYKHESSLVNDYEKALRIAKEQNKPVLIDFTGWACVNCRKMEEHVWEKPEIKQIIDNDYVLVSLYVDERTVLPDDEQFVFTSRDGQKKKIKTVGDKFATLQIENFKNASQPLYAVITPDEKLLTLPIGYTPSVEDYKKWLECGLSAFKK